MEHTSLAKEEKCIGKNAWCCELLVHEQMKVTGLKFPDGFEAPDPWENYLLSFAHSLAISQAMIEL